MRTTVYRSRWDALLDAAATERIDAWAWRHGLNPDRCGDEFTVTRRWLRQPMLTVMWFAYDGEQVLPEDGWIFDENRSTPYVLVTVPLQVEPPADLFELVQTRRGVHNG